MRRLLTLTAMVVGLTGGLAAQDRIYEIGSGVTSPVLIRQVQPRYTKAAMDRKVQGTVEMEAIVLKDGTVGDVTVKRSLDEELDDQAIKALKQWTFKPGTKEGGAVNVQVQIEMTFTLR